MINKNLNKELKDKKLKNMVCSKRKETSGTDTITANIETSDNRFSVFSEKKDKTYILDIYLKRVVPKEDILKQLDEDTHYMFENNEFLLLMINTFSFYYINSHKEMIRDFFYIPYERYGKEAIIKPLEKFDFFKKKVSKNKDMDLRSSNEYLLNETFEEIEEMYDELEYCFNDPEFRDLIMNNFQEDFVYEHIELTFLLHDLWKFFGNKNSVSNIIIELAYLLNSEDKDFKLNDTIINELIKINNEMVKQVNDCLSNKDLNIFIKKFELHMVSDYFSICNKILNYCMDVCRG